ncbi:hypothetical protein [Chryseolinea sp. H1M3-3]|uniref:hypothetical protein n=1 Tax=Chryseolinea sp. H1M3-3 TaxID=3034144 RepID=UPI0023EDFBEF|nr:hypothetical protein [Chryseolinea sp. H1M3-3]
MKTFYLVIVLFVFSYSHVVGRIKNGYESELQCAKTSLQKLNLLLVEDKNMTVIQRLDVKSNIEALINYISFYEITAALIEELRIVSPGIYNEIDSIKDKKGRPTDVYVKVVPRENSKVQLKAASFFERRSMDEDMNVSTYGDYSVSVDIWMVENALFLLSHELGHIKYIVPNLAEYLKFYEKKYKRPEVSISFVGHNPKDQSGKYANDFERRYLQDRKSYLYNGGEKAERLVSRLIRIRKDLRNGNGVVSASALESNYSF